MADIIQTTLVNYRESYLPTVYEFKDSGGDTLRTWSRKYEATIQVLAEGSVAAVLTYIRSFPEFLSSAGLGGFDSTIPIDKDNDFDLNGDLHFNEKIKDLLFYNISEFQGNYDKVSGYGKMSVIITLDVSGPLELIDLDTGEWSVAEPRQY